MRLDKAILLLVAVWALSAQALASDPTKPPGFGAERAAKIQYYLNSVLISDTRKVAIINGKALSAGESINGATVLSISHKLVRLDKNGRVIELKPKRVAIRREQ
ncbi:hypothetical protein [Dasania marina]|uniref:hypothetical protein n=1 Tax=Dasania marina TaxID=471499 RepID=UPI00035CFAAB|nr:hypothetical protein [Dasania marina]